MRVDGLGTRHITEMNISVGTRPQQKQTIPMNKGLEYSLYVLAHSVTIFSRKRVLDH